MSKVTSSLTRQSKGMSRFSAALSVVQHWYDIQGIATLDRSGRSRTAVASFPAWRDGSGRQSTAAAVFKTAWPITTCRAGVQSHQNVWRQGTGRVQAGYRQGTGRVQAAQHQRRSHQLSAADMWLRSDADAWSESTPVRDQNVQGPPPGWVRCCRHISSSTRSTLARAAESSMRCVRRRDQYKGEASTRPSRIAPNATMPQTVAPSMLFRLGLTRLRVHAVA
jgi:hypothetical protein